MSRVVSLRVKDEASARLERVARRLGRSVGATAALLLAEKLKEEEFAYIEFRATPAGRQPYIRGTRLAVWQVVLIARGFDMDARKVAEAYEFVREEQIRAALTYAQAYPDEIDPVLDYVENFTFEDLKRIVPSAQLIQV